MKPFARFHSQEQHEQLVNCLAEELRLRNQLSIYQGYRELGIKTLLEAEKYEVENKKRESEKTNAKQRAKASNLYSTGKTTNRRGSMGRGDVMSKDALQATEGHNLLQDEEASLCANLRMSSMEFLIVKSALKAASGHEGISKEDAMDGVKLEGHKVERIYELLLKQEDVMPPTGRRKTNWPDDVPF